MQHNRTASSSSFLCFLLAVYDEPRPIIKELIEFITYNRSNLVYDSATVFSLFTVLEHISFTSLSSTVIYITNILAPGISSKNIYLLGDLVQLIRQINQNRETNSEF